MAATTRFPPPEVLDLIFSNLERSDLLNSRLVCQDWNEDCLIFFKKPSSKFRITLSHRKEWDGYVKFVSSLSLPKPKVKVSGNKQKQKLQPVMPIHLKFKIKKQRLPSYFPTDPTSYSDCDSESGIDSDSFVSENMSDSDDEDEKAKRFKIFETSVKKLHQIFGSECIRDLTFFYPKLYGDDFMQKLVKILRKLSPGLEKLEIKLDFPSMDGKVVFPKVKHLSFDWFNRRPREFPNYNGGDFAWQLIQGCPNLDTLVLGDIFEKDTMYWPEELPFPPVGIKSFKFNSIPSNWLLRKMIEHPSLPVLEKLDLSAFRIIGIDADPLIGDFRNCREILRLFSSTLHSLSIRLITSIWVNLSGTEYEYVPFPVFPALKNLTIKDFDTNTIVDSCSDSNFKIDPAAFPVLESISIPFNLILNQPHADTNTQFPNVKYLEYFLYANYDDDEEDEKKAKIKDKFIHFQNLFPNVSTIAFRNHNKSHGLEFGALIREYLLKFMQLPDTASKIKTLELVNFDQNYLGVLLNQVSHPPRLVLENMGRNPLVYFDLLEVFEMLTSSVGSKVKVREEEQERPNVTIIELDNSPFQNYLTNVEKIRLVLTKEARSNFTQECQDIDERTEFEEYQHKSINAQKKLYLDEMVTSFPYLEEIEVSSVMFARNAASRTERIQKIMKKYPGLKINII